jgi:hypothetical protein
MSMQKLGPWTVEVRENKAGNLAIEVALDDNPHAEFVLQPGGTVDVGTKGKLRGLDMPGAPDPAMQKFRFGSY